MTTISTSASLTPLLNYGPPRLAYGTTPLTRPTLLAFPQQQTGLDPAIPPSLSPTPTPLLQAASTSQQTLNQEALSQLNQQWLQQLPPATPPATATITTVPATTATNPPAPSSDASEVVAFIPSVNAKTGEVTQRRVTKKFEQVYNNWLAEGKNPQDFPVANEGEFKLWRERQRIAFKKEINNQHAKFMKNQKKEAELIAKAKAKADADQYTEGSADDTA
ncbi:MAG: hypothetical protein ACKO34_08050 [Vampirovibrionales bacterium]